MHDKHVALTVSVPFEREEDVKGYVLVNYTVEGFEEEPGGGIIIYVNEEWGNEKQAGLDAALRELGARLVHAEVIENKDWNAEWEASIEPVQVTNELVITPSWKLDEAQAIGAKHLLVIDPKMSFGTGHHETTRLSLQLVEQIDCEGKTVFDVGTGTGALAMYALKRGAKRAVGIDTDEWSFKNAQENRSLNNFSQEEFDIRFGDLASTIKREERFDIVLANIHRNVLLPLAEKLYEHTAARGKLILSGLLTYDADEVRSAYAAQGFIFDTMLQEHEWVALMFSK